MARTPELNQADQTDHHSKGLDRLIKYGKNPAIVLASLTLAGMTANILKSGSGSEQDRSVPAVERLDVTDIHSSLGVVSAKALKKADRAKKSSSSIKHQDRSDARANEKPAIYSDSNNTNVSKTQTPQAIGAAKAESLKTDTKDKIELPSGSYPDVAQPEEELKPPPIAEPAPPPPESMPPAGSQLADPTAAQPEDGSS